MKKCLKCKKPTNTRPCPGCDESVCSKCDLGVAFCCDGTGFKVGSVRPPSGVYKVVKVSP